MAFIAYCQSPAARAESFSLSTITDFFKSDNEKTGGGGEGGGDAAPNPPADNADTDTEEPENLPDISDLPVLSLEEVRKHKTPDSVWVTYEGALFCSLLFFPSPRMGSLGEVCWMALGPHVCCCGRSLLLRTPGP